MTNQKHDLDEDACCVRCGFDAAEWWHLEKQKPMESRVEQPACEPRASIGGWPDSDNRHVFLETSHDPKLCHTCCKRREDPMHMGHAQYQKLKTAYARVAA